MVTQAQEQDLAQIKQLWKLCFGDPDPYIDFYFNSRYKKENTFCINVNDNVVSASQFFPYKLNYYKELLPAVYILGVCTHPLHRNAGYAGRILNHGLYGAQKNGMALAALIPQDKGLFELYRKYGFSEIFDVDDDLLCREDFHTSASLPSQAYVHTPLAFESLYRFYNQWYCSRQISLIKSKEDFLFAVEDLLVSGCQIFICGSPDNVQGFAAVYFGKPYTVKEILFYSEDVRYSLLRSIFLNEPEGLKNTSANVIYPAETGSPRGARKPLGMARVLNPAAFLNAWAASQTNPGNLDVSIKIEDPLLSNNNGIYHIHSGGISFSPSGKASYNFELNIQEFTQLILGYHINDEFAHIFRRFSPYANLLMN